MKEKLRSIVTFGKDFATGMGERKLTVYATSGCYYLFMSLVPIVMIVCCILPYTPFNQETILGYIDVYFAESLGEIIRKIVNAVYSSNAATLTVSIFLTLFSASASMKSLMNGMNAAYDVKRKDNVIVFTVRALLYMILLGVAILSSLIVMVYGGKILGLVTRYLPSVGILGWLLSNSRYLLVMLALGLVFLLLYYLMPAEKVDLKDQIPGAIFSAIIWVIFSAVFTAYVGISDKYGAYGFIGTIMVAMMWMYYCLFFLLIGGYMNSFLAERAYDDEDYEEDFEEEAEASEAIDRVFLSSGESSSGTIDDISDFSREKSDIQTQAGFQDSLNDTEGSQVETPVYAPGSKEAKKAEKEAKKAAKAAKKAEKDAKKAEKQEEKEAKKAEKEAKKADKEAKKAEKLAVKEADKAEKQALKTGKAIQKYQDNEAKKALKEEKQLQKENQKQTKETLKRRDKQQKLLRSEQNFDSALYYESPKAKKAEEPSEKPGTRSMIIGIVVAVFAMAMSAVAFLVKGKKNSR